MYVDLTTNKVVKFLLSQDVALPTTYLNDLRIYGATKKV